MSSPSNPPALLPAGRSRWVWLAVAAALGLWLILLLLTSDAPSEAQKNVAPEGGATRNPTFDSPAADLFTNRRTLKAIKASSRPLPPFPVRPNEGERE